MARIEPGESLWAFTRRESDGLYVLAAELVVRALTRNPPEYRYGAWRIWGDLQRSRYFDVELSPNIEPVVRTLGVQARGRRLLGQSFQGHAAVRELSAVAGAALEEFARDLPLLERVAIYPEDEFEARLVHDAPVQKLILRETRDEWSVRVRYLYETVDIQRARRNVLTLQDRYGGRCQICQYDPRARYGHGICHGHHIQWLSRGGEDELENMMLVCPNHHAAIHKDDAVFDYDDLSFRFSNGLQEILELNDHLPKADA